MPWDIAGSRECDFYEFDVRLQWLSLYPPALSSEKNLQCYFYVYFYLYLYGVGGFDTCHLLKLAGARKGEQ